MFSPETYIGRRAELKKRLGKGVVLLLGNDSVGCNYRDNEYEFRQDSTFLYYFGLNHDGLNAIIDVDNDRQIIGRTQPKFTGGFGLNATWKGFDFSAMFNFVVGNDVYNMDKIVTTQQYRNEWSNLRDFMGASTAWTYLDRATGSIVSDYETLKAMNEGKEYWSALTMSGNNPIATSWAVEDGSYLRLQTLTLGYTFPLKWTKKFACNQLRLY
ncbi:MAG: aminopeptidase P N-terminal domain-containing protein, partial [Muribaculaceae bacterium]|nr:aminopeptidase P N-terminal domain-containing protein [Muribaculaceae bacterium]